jgi:hypothetical protein
MDTVGQWSSKVNSSSNAIIERAVSIITGALPDGSFAEREQVALAIGNEVVRRVLLADLERITAELEGDAVLVDGRRYVRHQPGTVVYHSLCGPLPVRRHTYRDAAVRNGPTVVPLELAAGLVERGTPALGFAVVRGYAVHDSRHVEEDLRSAARVPPSRSTIERMAKDVGDVAVSRVEVIEQAIRRCEPVPDDAHAVVIGLDRTSVPMVARPEGPPQPSSRRRRPLERRSSGAYDVVFKMAYVGTVSFVDKHGETVAVRRYASPACDDPRELVPRMVADVAAALRRKPRLHVATIQDGAPEMWNRTREGVESLRARGLVKHAYEAIDRFHLMERLGNALTLVEDDAQKRAEYLAHWTAVLDEDDDAIDYIEGFLHACYRTLSTAKAAALWEELVYLRNNKDRMRYATLRRSGLPVGSGVTESAAKTVIGHRANRGGQRWLESGLRGALTLRAVVLSDRYPRFWRHVSHHYTARVEVAA